MLEKFNKEAEMEGVSRAYRSFNAVIDILFNDP
jgi:hypothetical protein